MHKVHDIYFYSIGHHSENSYYKGFTWSFIYIFSSLGTLNKIKLGYIIYLFMSGKIKGLNI